MYKEIRRKVENANFVVIVCVQGQPIHYQYKTLIGSIFGFLHLYMKYNKYHTMNFTLQQVLFKEE